MLLPCTYYSNFNEKFAIAGFITEKTLLPVTQLFFGRAFTTLTGLYSVAGKGRVESVYCNFDKLSTDPSKNLLVKLLY